MTKDATDPRPKMPKHTPAVFEVLKQCARNMTTISYGVLGERIGVHHRPLRRPLGYIRDEVCRRYDRPWLQMIVVNGGTKRPSEGAIGSTGVEFNKEEQDRWWRGMVLQVYAYDWSSVELDDE